MADVMMQGINRVIAPKQLLLVVDDLGKADYQCIKQILIQHLEAIFSLCVKMIFILSTALTVSPNFARVKDRADASFTLGMFDPLDKNVDMTKKSIQVLQQLVSFLCIRENKKYSQFQ